MKKIKAPKSDCRGSSRKKCVFSCRQLTKELLGIRSDDLFPKSAPFPIRQLFPNFRIRKEEHCQSGSRQEQSECGKRKCTADTHKKRKGCFSGNRESTRQFLRCGNIRLCVSTTLFRRQTSNAVVRVSVSFEGAENTPLLTVQTSVPHLPQSNGTKQEATL